MHQAPHGLQPQPQAAATFSPEGTILDKVGLRTYTDRWCYRVFQSAPELIRLLLPGTAAAANALGLYPGARGVQHYRYCFTALRL